MLLVATPREAPGSTFDQAVILIVDAEPNGIVSGICLNRPLDAGVLDTSALALLFVSEPGARAFWGGPMGRDPAILAQFSAVDGLEWFHLPIQQRRPFPLPEVGVIAVAEHTEPFEDRILRARLFIGLCVWGRGQLQAEVARGEWLVRTARAEDIFSGEPERLWERLREL
jgi:putative transcriptional regulator